MISIENVTKSFKNITAVSSLNFSVHANEIFGIVGPDGAGKSTLLRMMASILKPETGSILINGEDIFKDTHKTKENLAYMPQKFGLYEDLTVEENIYFFGRLFGVPRARIKERLKILYSFSHLEPFKNRLAGKLSGGMKQKLGLACSLVHNPKLVLLDEPTNGVDPVSRREFWKILYDLLTDGVTIVVSTAYLDEAERCNRIALMYKGGFIVDGTVDEVKKAMGKKFVEFNPSNPRQAEILLRKTPGLNGVIMTGNLLKFFVENPEEIRLSAEKILSENGIKILTWKESVPSLEDCFVGIIAERGENE